MLVTVIAAMVLACVPAPAQSGACNPQMLRGIWCMTCNGFIDLSNLDPRVPKNTLVPFSAIGRETIDADGKGTGKFVFSIAGNVEPVEMEKSFKVNPDCTGEAPYTLKAPSHSLTGKATIVYLPTGQEFHVLLLDPGNVVSCQYKKMYNTLAP